MEASNEPLTVLLPKFIRLLQETTAKRELYSDRKIIEDLMLCLEATKDMRVQALKDQAGLAKQLGNNRWLRTVARQADCLQFHSGEWIDENIHPRTAPSQRPTESPMATGSVGDIRLEGQADIESRTDILRAASPMEVTISAEEEERLLAESPQVQEPSTSEELKTSKSGSQTSEVSLVTSMAVPRPVSKPRSSNTETAITSAESEKTRQTSGYRSPRRSSPSRHISRPHRRRSPRKHTSPSPRRRSPRKHGYNRPSHASSPRRTAVRSPRKTSPRRPTAAHARGASPTRKRPASRSVNQGDRKYRPGPPVSRQVQVQDQCPAVGCKEPVSRKHAATHLPGIFDDQMEPTEELIRRRISILQICESRLLGTVGNLQSLTEFVSDLRQVNPGHYKVSIQQSKAMAEMCRIQGYAALEEYSVAPINSPAALLHWRVLLVIFACLNDADRKDLVGRYPVCTTWMEEEGLPQGFDSHFHLDRTRRALNRPGATVEDICAVISPDRDYRIKLAGGVVVFCDPSTYPARQEMQDLESQGFTVAIGMHPKGADNYTDADFQAFQRCLEYPEVRVLGEVGLDYTVDPSRWGMQHVVLDRVLKQLQPAHVLSLHARGMTGTQSGLGYMQLLYQLKGVVPAEQRIHLHCFEGNRDLMERWTREYPETCFGFTGLVKNFNSASKEALFHVKEDKLLLETDSPYFHLGGRRNSSPALLGMVANLVARVRDQTWKEVLEITLRNARRLYCQ